MADRLRVPVSWGAAVASGFEPRYLQDVLSILPDLLILAACLVGVTIFLPG